MEVETQKSEQDLKADDVDCNPTKPNPSTEYDESTVERVKTSTATATRSTFRSPSPVEGAFEPEDFRTSTPTADERSRRDPEEPCASFRRSSAWKDYVMSHNPILFQSYVNTQYPKRSWRHSHQKVAARHCGKYRRSSSGRIRKPPTPKSLRISWNSLDDVVRVRISIKVTNGNQFKRWKKWGMLLKGILGRFENQIPTLSIHNCCQQI